MATSKITLSTSKPFVLPVSDLTLSNSLQIFWHSETAGSGDHISVQGHFSNTATIGLVLNDGNTYSVLRILSQRTGYIKALISDYLPNGVYQIFVIEGGIRSYSKFINKALSYGANSSIIYSGCKMSICGRNLIHPGRTPTIRFVSQTSSSEFFGSFSKQGSSSFKLNLIAPLGLTIGHTYDIYVSNGYGGVYSESRVNDVVTAIAISKDVIGLNVGWHSHFTSAITSNIYNAKTDVRLSSHLVGDGVANDLPAMNTSLEEISAAGGGIYLLPIGSYKCEGGGFYGLSLRGNVIIKGAGTEKTTITYGTGPVISKFFGTYETSTIGVVDLTIRCLDPTGSFGAGLMQKGGRFFLKNVKWFLKKGDWLEIQEMDNIAFLNSEMYQEANSSTHGPVTFDQCAHYNIEGSVFSGVTGLINSNKSSKAFIRSNKLVRDLQYSKVDGSILHLMICEFMKDSIIEDNVFSIANGPIPRNEDGSPLNNDGETIISENGGGYNADFDHGVATSGGASTLTDGSKAWATSFDFSPSVSIVKGKGAGQVRKILSRTSTTLTVEQAWDIIPDSTSGYSIFNFGLERVIFSGNSFRDQQRGFTLYHNPIQRVDIVNNSLINSGSIDITTIQQDIGKNKFTPIYNVEVRNNTVDGSSDLYNGVSIGIQSIQHVVRNSWGTICTGLRVQGNTLIGTSPNLGVIQDDIFPSGYNNYVVFHQDGANAYIDEGVPVILGSIFQDNTAKDIEEVYHLNTGSYETSVNKTTKVNSPLLIDDDRISGTGHASVGTVII